MNIKTGLPTDAKKMIVLDSVPAHGNEKSNEKRGELSLDCVYSFMKLLSLKDLRSALLVCKLWHQVAIDRFLINAFQFKTLLPVLNISDISPFTASDKAVILPLDKRITVAVIKKLLAMIQKVNGAGVMCLFYGVDTKASNEYLAQGYKGEWLIDIHRSGKIYGFNVYQCKHNTNGSVWEYNVNVDLNKTWSDQNSESEKSKLYQLNIEVKFWNASKKQEINNNFGWVGGTYGCPWQANPTECCPSDCTYSCACPNNETTGYTPYQETNGCY